MLYLKINSHKKDKKTAGNALFLILIAVALFAALSYAVTQSGRGGGNIDREQLELDVAQLMDQASLIRSFYQRMMVMNAYDQIHMSNAAESASGTVYLPDGSSTTGSTVGIFNTAVTGIVPLYPPESLWDSASGYPLNQFGWSVAYNQVLTFGGSHEGTSLGDTFVAVGAVTEGACALINERLGNGSSIPTLTYTAGSANRDLDLWQRDGTLFTSNTIEDIAAISAGSFPACVAFAPGVYFYALLIEAN